MTGNPCALCLHGSDYCDGTLGPLLGPLNDVATGKDLFVHRYCALWSPEVIELAIQSVPVWPPF